jgi:hypothetical protein
MIKGMIMLGIGLILGLSVALIPLIPNEPPNQPLPLSTNESDGPCPVMGVYGPEELRMFEEVQMVESDWIFVAETLMDIIRTRLPSETFQVRLRHPRNPEGEIVAAWDHNGGYLTLRYFKPNPFKMFRRLPEDGSTELIFGPSGFEGYSVTGSTNIQPSSSEP